MRVGLDSHYICSLQDVPEPAFQIIQMVACLARKFDERCGEVGGTYPHIIDVLNGQVDYMSGSGGTPQASPDSQNECARLQVTGSDSSIGGADVGLRINGTSLLIRPLGGGIFNSVRIGNDQLLTDESYANVSAMLSSVKEMVLLQNKIVVPAGKKIVVPSGQPALSTLNGTWITSGAASGSSTISRSGGTLTFSVLKETPTNCKKFSTVFKRLAGAAVTGTQYYNGTYPTSEYYSANDSTVINRSHGFQPSYKADTATGYDRLNWGAPISPSGTANDPNDIVPVMGATRQEINDMIDEALAETSNIHAFDVTSAGDEIVGPAVVSGFIFEDPTTLGGTLDVDYPIDYNKYLEAIESVGSTNISIDLASWIVDV